MNRFATTLEETMTKMTTATLLVSGKGFGPFGSPGWRIGQVLQLVEGSGRGPYFFIDELTQGDPTAIPRSMAIDSLEPNVVAESIVLALACCVGSGHVIDLLIESTNLDVEGDGRRRISEGWKLTSEMLRICADDLASDVRIAAVILDSRSLIDDKVLGYLREWGFEVLRADVPSIR
jgi:hypothetical protein